MKLTLPNASPSHSFYVTGGTLPRNAESYVTRQADGDLLAALERGEFCYILTARQMGKSSLMVRTATRLRENGVAVAVIDLTAFGTNLSPEQWYACVLNRIGREIDCEDELDDFYTDTMRLSPLNRFVAALEQIVLQRIFGRIVLFVDEIDVVRSLPFSADEFFAAIRELYNRRADDPNLARLTFGLFGVASPSDLIKDARITPFNIGRRIELKDFTRADAQVLASGFAQQPNDPTTQRPGLLDRIFHWTNGHPYLTQRVCAEAVEQQAQTATDIDRIVSHLFLDVRARDTEDNLKFVSHRLLNAFDDTDTVLARYADILKGKRVADDDTDPIAEVLRLSGIVRSENGVLKVRNRIYERVFDAEWIHRQTTPAEVRRQQEAFRAGRRKTLTYAGVVAAGFAMLAAFGFAQAFRADKNATAAQMATKAERTAKNAAQQDSERANRNARAAALAQGKETEARKRADKAVVGLTQANRTKLAALERETNAKNAERTAKNQAINDADRARRAEAAAKRAQAQESKARKEAVANTERANHFRYIANMNLIQQYDSQKNSARVMELLKETKPQGSHSFEWGYWQRQYSRQRSIMRLDPKKLIGTRHTQDGKFFMTYTVDGTLKVSDYATKQLVFTRKLNLKDVPLCDISQDGTRILTGKADGAIEIHAIPSWNIVQTFKIGTTPVIVSEFSYDDKRVLAGTRGTSSVTVKIWDYATGKELRSITEPGFLLPDREFSPDGKRVVTTYPNGLVKIWQVDTTSAPLELKGHNEWVVGVAFSPDGKRIATGSIDTNARVWDATTGKEICLLKGHTGFVNSVVFTPDGKRVITGGRDSSARVWDAETGKELYILKGIIKEVGGVGIYPDGKRITSFGSDGDVCVWDIEEQQNALLLIGHKANVTTSVFFPDGKHILTSSYDGTAKIWEAATGKVLQTLEGHGGNVLSAVYSPDGTRIVTGNRNGTTEIWEAATGRLLQTLHGHKAASFAVAFSPDGTRILTGSLDGTAKLWDAATGKELLTLKGHGNKEHSNWISSVAFSPDGKRIVTGSYDNTAKIWDASTGKVLHTLTTHTDCVFHVAFSPDGKWIATASNDMTAKVWNATTGMERYTLTGHTNNVLTAVFSPDSKRIVTGSRDTTAKIWDVETGKELLTLNGHTGHVYSAGFSPDGKRIVTGGWDNTVRVWSSEFDAGK